jgi:hypothetical protein
MKTGLLDTIKRSKLKGTLNRTLFKDFIYKTAIYNKPKQCSLWFRFKQAYYKVRPWLL